MKYLTREWYVKARLSYIDGSVRCSKLAEKFDESFYKAVYKKRYEKFERNERLRDEFRDPQEDLKKYEDVLSIVEAFEVVKLQLLECSSEHDLFAFCLSYGCLEQREDYLKVEKALNINLRL